MKKIFFLPLISVIATACSDAVDDPNTQLPSIPTDPVQERIIQRSLPYLDRQEATHYYTLSLPENYREQSALPVIMYLHGRGGNENSDVGSSHYIDNMIAECNGQYPLIVYPSDVNKFYVQDNNYHLAFGLLEQVAQDYPLGGVEKRMIIGFSDGGSGAFRTPLVNPGSYKKSFSWSGWVWRKDQTLFDAIVEHADELRTLGFKGVYFVGDNDHKRAYDPLISLLEQHGVGYKHTVLENQSHNLGHYHVKTRPQLKEELCEMFAAG